MTAFDYLRNFLLNNGFKETVKTKTSTWFTNYKCSMQLYPSSGYVIRINDDWQMFSDDYNVYKLVGQLTWYDLIDKDYNKECERIL